MTQQMKLSEAMRLGGMATDQGHGPDSIISDTAPCALGAARCAIGLQVKRPEDAYRELEERFPILRARVSPPWNVDYVESLTGIVWMLNDYYHWSRERIADFVEQIERAQEEKVGCADALSLEPALESRALAQK